MDGDPRRKILWGWFVCGPCARGDGGTDVGDLPKFFH
jgi:hypothetical protein